MQLRSTKITQTAKGVSTRQSTSGILQRRKVSYLAGVSVGIVDACIVALVQPLGGRGECYSHVTSNQSEYIHNIIITSQPATITDSQPSNDSMQVNKSEPRTDARISRVLQSNLVGPVSGQSWGRVARNEAMKRCPTTASCLHAWCHH